MKRTGITVERDHVIVTNGVSEAFDLIARTCRGGRFLVQDPFYYLMVEIFRFHGSVMLYPCVEEQEWHPDIDRLRAILENSDAPFEFLSIITPNNPTGAVYPRSVLKQLIDLAGEHDLLIITNEIYDEFNEKEFTSVLSMSKDVPIVYLNGFSKGYRLPGMRVGYMVFHDVEGRKAGFWETVSHHARLRSGVNLAGQVLAAASLKEPAPERKRIIGGTWAKKQVLEHRIARSDLLSTVPSRGGTFILPKVPVDDLQLCKTLLAGHGYFIYPGSCFGEQSRNHVCLVFLESEKHLVEGVDAMEAVVRDMRSSST